MPRQVSKADWRPRGVLSLEPAAEDVVRSQENTLVIAGPGAGKTELLAQRASFLLETGQCGRAKRVLAISFKRDAARNLRDRVELRSGAHHCGRFDSYTFDALSKTILDQFHQTLPAQVRPSSDYEVLLKQPETEELDEILRQLEPPGATGEELRQFAQQSFFSRDVPRAPLFRQPKNLREWAARALWQVLLTEGPASRLSFRMITRLAGEILQRDNRIQRAYRTSFAHAFLDEFQDTTDLQYWLTKLLFKGTSTVVVAVGDPQQRIMRWAHALDGVFAKFVDDFGARSVRLTENYRASASIKQVVLYVSDNLDVGTPLAPRATATASSVSSNCTLNLFPSETAEASWMSDEVAKAITQGTAHRDIGILVRQRAVDYAEQLIVSLATRGIAARVEDSYQDLLAEPIVKATLLGLVALATEQPGSNWAKFRNLVGDSRALSATDSQRWRALGRELESLRTDLRRHARRVPSDPTSVRELLRRFVEPCLAHVRATYPRYRQGDFYGTTLDQLSASLAADQEDGFWEGAVATVRGRETVPILTIHKSKGLEYDIVFFVGLEDSAFWNYRSNPNDEAQAFFVGLSRARQRVEFTFAGIRQHTRYPRQSSTTIRRLYELAQNAGANVVNHS